MQTALHEISQLKDMNIGQVFEYSSMWTDPAFNDQTNREQIIQIFESFAEFAYQQIEVEELCNKPATVRASLCYFAKDLFGKIDPLVNYERK